MKNSPKKVGSYEAKTRLPSLLAEAAAGREIIITKRDRPIAKIVPYSTPVSKKEIFDRIRAFHGQIKLPKGETTKDLIEAGRRI
jgi:prevent-host-death family protein